MSETFVVPDLRGCFSNKIEAAAWLGGMIDGEGTVTKRQKRRCTRLRIYSTDLTLIAACHEALCMLEVKSFYTRRINRAYGPNHNPLYEVEVWGQDALQTVEIWCPVFSSHKRQRIKDGVEKLPNIRYGDESSNPKLRSTQIPEIRKLLKQGKTQSAITREYGVSRTTIGLIKRRKIWAAA